ncbi:DUF2730 family protein [Roseibium sediminis]|uniref:DUF2730 family protein n=1 Tax=Roseibium sediminis TaxID=1775174 RepID=UPI00123DB325|nr:DUF2730 family protein [Roseibium sediminis]
MFEWIKGLEAAFGLAGALFGSIALIVSWITRGSKANAVSIAKLETEQKDLCDRISDLERVIRNQPTKDDFHKLEMVISELNGNIGKVTVKLNEVDHLSKRIDDFLRNRRSGA